MDHRTARTIALLAGALALALVGVATLRGFMPGDAEGAARMSGAQDTGLISAALGLAALLPLGWFRWVLAGGAVVFLALASGFYAGLFT
ncbi:hypothetical protein [Serinicoccus kebangsaanensis]|uniref:hypothetical protein n=1 Tax=Serinicoccus kebangsaanensis TaxID=2602069 RepID=UPI00124C0DD0|nr:hypothetical protein [Serinicoccus kebangsaanensis]